MLLWWTIGRSEQNKHFPVITCSPRGINRGMLSLQLFRAVLGPDAPIASYRFSIKVILPGICLLWAYLKNLPFCDSNHVTTWPFNAASLTYSKSGKFRFWEKLTELNSHPPATVMCEEFSLNLKQQCPLLVYSRWLL